MGCNKSDSQFNVSGAITQASDSMLYFEAISLEGILPIDSVKLDKSGGFDFKGNRPFTPEFYRLRIGGQIINLSIDSTETVIVKAAFPQMATKYTIEGSEHCQVIKRLSLLQIELQQQVIAVAKNNGLTVGEQNKAIENLINAYKEKIKHNFIAKNPAAPSSYFALFQTLGRSLIFNPVSNPEDVKWIGAVATAWDELYPGTIRAENLHNIAIQGMHNTRAPRKVELKIDESKIKETGVIDISLFDINGNLRKLSSMAGKVVLLDFTVYASRESKERILELRELYNKYAAKGFDVYQVSLDPNEHYWKTSCEHLPWICVRDPEAAQSDYLVMYQVKALPCYFLIDRGNNIVARKENISDLETAIEALL